MNLELNMTTFLCASALHEFLKDTKNMHEQRITVYYGDGGGPPTCHKVGGERAKGSFMRFIIDKINCKNHVLLSLHCFCKLQ